MARSSVTRLDEALVEYAYYLERRPLSDNTRKAFWGDVNMFARFLTPHEQAPESDVTPGQTGQITVTVEARKLSSLTTERIKDFIAHEEKRANANNPKSIERRLTSLKVFFKWLHESGYIAVDPAENIPYRPLVDPLPEYLTEEQAAAVVEAAKAVAGGDRLDTRPLAIIQLVLDTGMKKGECLKLTVDDIERSPRSVTIRYDKKHLKFKERQLLISQECLSALDLHIKAFSLLPHRRLFDCTGRNLEYIFNRKIAPPAGLPALTFEMLRWTCALRDYRDGTLDDEQLQYKYGLSPLGWSEMEAKLARLVKGEA